MVVQILYGIHLEKLFSSIKEKPSLTGNWTQDPFVKNNLPSICFTIWANSLLKLRLQKNVFFMQAHELGIVSVVVDLGNGKSTTTAELRRKEDAKYSYICIVAVTMFMAFHLPRVVPNIVELVSPEAAKQNVSSFFKWCGTLKDTLGQLKNSKSLKFLSKIKF